MTTPEVDLSRTTQSRPLTPGCAAEAEDVLRRLVGDESAAFREGQLEAIAALVDGGRRVLVVQRTGWGKSAVYFVATALLRARGRGPTIIVSPLLALMRDQVAAAQRAGLTAMTINSANADEWGADQRRAGRRRGRPAAGQPRAPQQPAVPRRAAAPARRRGRAARRRRGPLHQRLGTRLPARLPAHPRPAGLACRSAGRCWPRRPRPTSGWSTTSRSSSRPAAPRCAPIAARCRARACGSACSRCRRPRRGSAG